MGCVVVTLYLFYVQLFIKFDGTEEEVKERASRAAAAARRWREYSRRGVDKPASYKLPDTVSSSEK